MNFSPFNSPNPNNSSKNWKPKHKGDLPLYYKDKAPTSPHPKASKSKLIMLFKGFVASIALYILYYYTIGFSPATTNPIGREGIAIDWKTAQTEVRDVFLESWDSYERFGWGKDVFHPVSRKGENMGPKPLGWMIVDSLDTLMIMDCPEQIARARKWVKEDLNYSFDYEVNVFETTIRMLGGLLSAFHLSKDDLYLDKAADLANALIGGFASTSGLPYASVNLLTGKGIKNHVDGGASSTAEVATLQLEFKYLSKLTGELLFWQKAEKVMEVLDKAEPLDGLVPIYVQPDSGKFLSSIIRLGSRGDSYYEYLLKQYLQTDKKESIYWDMYRESVDGVKKHLISKTKPNGLTFIGEKDNGIAGPLSTKMDHLVCFYGGLLAVGATGGLPLEEARKLNTWDADLESDFKLGAELTETCYRMYHDVEATGLSPEIVVFNEDGSLGSADFIIKPLDKHNLQRPETVESLFYLYRITKDVKYRQWGYEIFQNFIKHTKIVGADGVVSYSSLKDVTQDPPVMGDNMESFWLAETLKYLYLLFDDTNKFPLDEYVFNTEAHPFPVFDMEPLFKTGWSRSFDDPRRLIQEKKRKAKAAAKIKEDTKIDKKHPPKAAPVAKPIDVQANEVMKEAAV